jgi:hypothetical protein
VREWIIPLAKEYERYGYQTVTDLLRLEGWDVGNDRGVHHLAARRSQRAKEAARAHQGDRLYRVI